MSIALLVITDGRVDCIERTIASLRETIGLSAFSDQWIYDDSADPQHREWLVNTFPEFHILWHPGGRQGFGGAIRAAWGWLGQLSTADHVFHSEDDFVYLRDPDLAAMANVLDRHPYIVQLALRRQPWNEAERAAGGIVEQHPDDYADCGDDGNSWLEHRKFFTTNPSLYRRSLLAEGWPDGVHSEGRFGIELLERHPDWRFAFWGSRDSGEAVEHIGHQRVGVGY